MSRSPWLSILGIGEDGVDGLSGQARGLLSEAEFVFGGTRHLALARELIHGEAAAWPVPLGDPAALLLSRRPRRCVVLASGDPFWFGIGSLLARGIPADEFICLPQPSAFSLACARLGWSLQTTRTLSVCGRPVEALVPALQPAARLLVLCADAASPAAIAGLLAGRGFGAATLHLMQALGGPRERIVTRQADQTLPGEIDPLTLLAIALPTGAEASALPLACGLDDAAFEHDGQMTRREIRALTLSALAPRQGELLWDIGCGSGAIAIEWMLCHPACRAVGIEPDPARRARAARNARALGVPGLQLHAGAAPLALDGLPPPDAVFIGGGASDPGVLDAACLALRSGGRLVANAVTLETEALLIAHQARHGGTLTRFGIDRLDTIGSMHALRPAMRILQWAWHG
ncbi:precorrin-6y C5,15-methyltransferase (decarboxylating) subunit CbiE [Lichenicoccus sp.]|uniref:precorrin-6y C5,15-methyltransferase (decarboxylating) subunit CbiE n=1 Tax=Lichenicoccus sp. TaxID=2781899 RepID=UPI003D0A2B49